MSVPPVPESSSPSRPDVFRVFGDPRFHADGEIAALAFASDGTLWSVEEPGILRQWKPATGVSLLRRELSELETLWAFSDPARLLASASDDLSIWDLATGKRLTTVPMPSWVTSVTFSADQRHIATGHDDGKVRLWESGSWKLVRELIGHDKPVSALAFSADGGRLASAGEDRTIHLWDVSSGDRQVSLAGHTDRIPSLAWHPQGQRLVSAGWDTTARVWDTTTGEPVILLNSHADQVLLAAFSPDGRILACADSANAIHLWHAIAWTTLHVLNEHQDEIRCLAFNREGHQLATAGAERVIHLWDPQKGQILSGRNSPARHAISLATAKSGPRLASTSGGAGIRVWDVASGRAVLNDDMPGTLAVTAEPDGRWLASGGADAKIHIWQGANCAPHMGLFGQRGPVAALAHSPREPLIASACASDGTAWVWNLEKGEPALLIVEAADGCTVEALAFHPTRRWLACAGIDWMATGGSDGAICVWNLDQPGKVALFEYGATGLAFHPQGRWLAAASLSEVVYLWDVDTQQLVAELGGHRDGVGCVAFSPDGQWLASGSDDHTLRIWNSETRELATMHELDTSVQALAFSADGRFLFTGNGNTTCYQLEVAKLLEE